MPFRVWLTDIDVSVMNHAAMMTVIEMGRADLMVRSNFFKMATKNNWYFPNQAINVQFYRPLKMFEKATVYTKISYVSDTYFHIQQKIIRNGKPVAACFANGLAKRGRETIPTAEIIAALHIDPDEVPRNPNDFVKMFDDARGGMTEMIIDNWDINE